MKRILTVLAILVSFAATAQIPGSTTVNSRYDWLGGRLKQLKLPAYSDTSQVPTWAPWLSGDAMLDTSGGNAGTIYVRYGSPRAWHRVGSTGGGSGGISLVQAGYALTAIDDSTLQLSYTFRDSLYSTLFKISDTASAFAGYTRITRFQDSLTAVQTRIQTKQATLVSGTNIKTINSNSLLGSGNITISAAASDEANVMDYFADSTGSRGSALAFQNAIASGKDVYVPKGRYKIDSTLALRTGQKIRGSGTLFTTTAGSAASYAGMFHIMTVAKYSFVDGLTFYGTAGKQAGFSGTYSAQNGIQIVGDSVNIMNCKFIALTGSGILGMYFSGSFQPNTFGQINNCFFDNCTAGVYNYLGGDYQTLSNSTAVNCYYGVLQNTANAKVVGCTLDYNNIGFAGLYNSDRGVLSSTSLNHNQDALKIISATSNGYMITGCTFYYGHITLTDADRVVFTGCSFGVNGNITVNGTVSPNRVAFYNSYQTSGLTTNWITGGTGVIINPGLQSYNISRSVDTIYRKTAQDSIYFKLGGTEFAIKDSTGGSGGSSALSALTAATGANTISNTGKQLWRWDALGADTALVLASNNTTASGGTSHVLAAMDLRGANATINQTTFGLAVNNRKTGTGSINVGLGASASGGDKNIAISVATGAVALNTTEDGWNLASKPTSDKSGMLLQSLNSSSQASITYSETGVGNWSAGLGGDSRFIINNGGDFTGTNLFTVDNTGRIGVGSHNALSKLDINGAIRVRDSILMARSAVVSASTSDSVVVRIASTGQLATRAQSDIAGSGSGVSSVTGTTNRITSSGGTTPAIDIAATYVGQTSLTTLGTVTTGTLSTGAVIGGVTMTLGSDAANDIYYRNGSGVLTRLANGATGTFLGANTGAAPSWQTPASGGTNNFNNSATGFPLVIHSTQAIKPLSVIAPMVLDSTTNTGNLTISMPAATTAVAGYISTANGQIIPGLKLGNAGLGATGALGSSPNNDGIYLQYNTAGYLDAINPSTTTWQQLNIRGSLLNFYVSGTQKAVFSTNGLFVGGSTTPTAKLHLGAETATASSEPIRFVVPAAQTSTAVSQAFGPSTTGDNLTYVIATGAARKNLVLADIALTSTRIPFSTTNGRMTDEAGFTHTGNGKIELGTSGATQGQLDIDGVTSGKISVKGVAAAGTYNFNLPTTAGTTGDYLTSGGGGSTAMTWTTPTVYSSGTYTPTVTNSTNAGSITGAQGFYIRVGNVVDVTVYFSCTPTAATTNTSLTITLPIASNFTLATDLRGVGGAASSLGNIANAYADPTTDVAQTSFVSESNTNHAVNLHFKYTILP